MTRTVTSGDDAILHRTTVGHIVDPETGVARPTRRFMLPYSMGPAGARTIITVRDLLRFAQVHLSGGLSPEGERLLSEESVRLMATETSRSAAITGLSFGLGWMISDAGGFLTVSHGGGSYGGLATLVVVPERRFAFAAFGNSTMAGNVHQRMTELALTRVAGLPPARRVERTLTSADPIWYAGTYRKQFNTSDVTAGEDGTLVLRITQDYDAEHRGLFSEYVGREVLPPVTLVPVTETLFVPHGVDPETLTLPGARAAGVSFVDSDESGKFRYILMGGRVSRRS